MGVSRLALIVAWLRRHETTLDVKVAADVDTASLVPTSATEAKGGDRVIVGGGDPGEPRLAPCEHLAVPAELSGAAGFNRATSFAFICAEHDLAAVHAYLHRYRDRPTTLRAYTRELERLILWSVVIQRKALSSLTVEDCEAYKDFLQAPLASFTGPKRPRTSGRWRPFSTDGLSADSQAYAVRVLRAAFAWLVEVRYLAGNPWSAVHEPATVTRESSVQVDRALPAHLWSQVRKALDGRCAGAGSRDADNDRYAWRCNAFPKKVPRWPTSARTTWRSWRTPRRMRFGTRSARARSRGRCRPTSCRPFWVTHRCRRRRFMCAPSADVCWRRRRSTTPATTNKRPS